MGSTRTYKMTMITAALGLLSACGGSGLGLNNADNSAPRERFKSTNPDKVETNPNNTIWALFNKGAADTEVSVNKYLWSASLEVLDFLPVQSVDPFTGVIVTGYGIPPGGSRSYRATVLIDDPALDARSLHIALQTQGGRAVSSATANAVENAILSRAREMRVSDSRF